MWLFYFVSIAPLVSFVFSPSEFFAAGSVEEQSRERFFQICEKHPTDISIEEESYFQLFVNQYLIDTADKCGRTALMKAAFFANWGGMERLITQYGANMHSTDRFNYSVDDFIELSEKLTVQHTCEGALDTESCLRRIANLQKCKKILEDGRQGRLPRQRRLTALAFKNLSPRAYNHPVIHKR